MATKLAASLMNRIQRGPTELELSARLESDGSAAASKRDQGSAFDLRRRHPAMPVGQALKHRPNASFAFVSDRHSVVRDTEFLRLGSNNPPMTRCFRGMKGGEEVVETVQ